MVLQVSVAFHGLTSGPERKAACPDVLDIAERGRGGGGKHSMFNLTNAGCNPNTALF